MGRHFLGALIGCAALALAASESGAHALHVFAWQEDGGIAAQCGFGKNRPAAGARVRVLGAGDQRELAAGEADAQGRFTIALPKGARGVKIICDAGQGHRGEWEMEIESAPEPEDAPGANAAGEAPDASGSRAESETSRAGSAAQSLSPAVLQSIKQIMRAELERELAPMRRDLAELAARGPGISEIIGGIGWILGLAGAAFYFKSRKG